MNCIEQVTEILDLLYKHDWDERNGGNLSYILKEDEVKEVCDINNVIRTFHYDFDLSDLVGKYFVITGTGKYFKNCLKDPKNNLGIMKVTDAHTLSLLWGYEDGGRPTSESPTHLKCHIERLMQTESIVVFPEGIAVLPWILCGGEEIGIATAEKMKEYRSVVWAQHGIFCTGKTLDEVFGLIETIEKAAEIYMKIFDKKIYQSITNENLIELAKAFKIEYRKGIID